MRTPEATTGERRIGELVGPAAAWAATATVAVMVVLYYLERDGFGYDAHAYWRAGRTDNPYDLASPGFRDAYLYSPVFAQVVRPLAVVPFAVFYGGWLALEAGIFWWLTRSLSWRWRGPVLLLCVPELVFGNVYGLLALAAVLGLRRPGFWAFPILTKLTTGAAGVVWFAVRGEWRALGTLVAWTTGITLVSYALEPGLWHDWVRLLLEGDDGSSQLLRAVRMMVAVALVAWGARHARGWVLPLAMLLLAPHLSLKIKDVAILAATPATAAEADRAPHRTRRRRRDHRDHP